MPDQREQALDWVGGQECFAEQRRSLQSMEPQEFLEGFPKRLRRCLVLRPQPCLHSQGIDSHAGEHNDLTTGRCIYPE